MPQLPPSRLPNFRNLGVLLRALVLAQLLRLVYGWVQAPGGLAWWQSLLDAATLYEPVMLTAALLLYALAPVLERMAYRPAVATVVALAALVAAAWHSALAWGVGLSLPGSAGHNASVAALVAGAVLFYFNWRHHRLSPALANARMTALQARIRPHFLYNSLNSVLALLRSNPRSAEALLHDLADLYRSLLADARTLVSLEQEIALARAYVNIEQRRLGERLRLHWLCDHVPAQALVPALLLQPLLENAVRYGVEPNPQGADVTLQAVADDTTLLLYVRNTLAPPAAAEHVPQNGNHMALDNIRERLALHFDAEASLRIQQTAGEFEVLVRLPLKM